MFGKTGIRRDKATHFIKSYKDKEIVESHDYSCPKDI